MTDAGDAVILTSGGDGGIRDRDGNREERGTPRCSVCGGKAIRWTVAGGYQCPAHLTAPVRDAQADGDDGVAVRPVQPVRDGGV